MLSATPRVAAVYRRPEEYRANDTGLVILDRFIPPQRPQADSLWIDPPAMGSPIPVRTTVEQAAFSHWDTEHPGAAGLHTKDFKLEHTKVFEVGAGDGRIGEVAAGPVIVARPGKPKVVVLGFHPVLCGMRYELATPLLFANLLRWISPEIFRRYEISGGSVGAVKLVMDEDTAAADVKVTAADGSALPFTMRERTLNFFSGVAGRCEGGGGRPRVPLLADAAGTVGIEVDAARRCAPRRPALRADSGIVDRSVAVAGLGGRLRAAGGVGALRPLPPRHEAERAPCRTVAEFRGAAADRRGVARHDD